ncbi:hypothetical protein, conserved [Plasmodium gonderi]|uniref:Importin N-terminal domain-containing protein n=1 Tax=Plasmodium gonderi TaxID=77519 RepID=A0A1Y1JR10_PLAGO|nr:hypothetical protein, conserved [Plasmodium gonderi]GAW82913.1 hypothetical protein, conserved [Plasmodium gonderi]
MEEGEENLSAYVGHTDDPAQLQQRHQQEPLLQQQESLLQQKEPLLQQQEPLLLQETASSTVSMMQGLAHEGHRKIVDVLYDTWSNDENRRKEAEKILSELEKEEDFILHLLEICCYRDVHYNVRKLAIIYSKNLVCRFWSCKDAFHLSNEVKGMVKKKILDMLNNLEYVGEYYKEFCILLRKVARYELVHNFPELLNFFLNNMNIHKNNLHILYMYMYLLYKVLREQYTKKLLKDKRETFDISEKFINYLYPFWKNNMNMCFKKENTEPCACSNESNCNKCYGEYSIVMEHEKQLTFFFNSSSTESNNLEEEKNNNNHQHNSNNSYQEFSSDMNSGKSEEAAYCSHFNSDSYKKIKILKFVDSIMLNLIIIRNDVQKAFVRARVGTRIGNAAHADGDAATSPCTSTPADVATSPYTSTPADVATSPYTSTPADVATSPYTSTPADVATSPYTSTHADAATSDKEGTEMGKRFEMKKKFFNCLTNKTIFYLKFVSNKSTQYYLKYLKFLLGIFLHIVEFQNSFHEYLKRDTIEKFICLFLKKHLNKNIYINSDHYENKFLEIINLCISILKSLFYHFCLSQYNLIKQKKIRENYLNVKNIMNNNQNVFFGNYNEKSSLESKIINNLVVNINNMECENKSGRFNKNYSFKDILTYIREEVKNALTNDNYILMHNQKALEIFDFLRVYCINMSAEQIIDIILNSKDKDAYQVEENIFYSTARECIIEISSEPFLFSIFSHFFEPLINAFHNYAHMIKALPNNLKDIQIPQFSEAIIHLDGYLNIYYILYPSIHRRIKIEHILCMIHFFMDFLEIQYTHPLISYRIALIIKVWIKNYKASFPFIDEIALLIFENIRLIDMHISQKYAQASPAQGNAHPEQYPPSMPSAEYAASVLSPKNHNKTISNSILPTDVHSSVPSSSPIHYASKSSNFLPLVFFKFVCLFRYMFKYEYVYENYDYFNEFLVVPLISLLTKITYPKSIQKILQILSHIVFMSNKEKDITIFKENYNFLLDLYMTSNISIKEYLLNIVVQILNKNYDEYTSGVSTHMNRNQSRSDSPGDVSTYVSHSSDHINWHSSDHSNWHSSDHSNWHSSGFYQGENGHLGAGWRGENRIGTGSKDKGRDDLILFYFSFDIIAYTILGKIKEENISQMYEGYKRNALFLNVGDPNNVNCNGRYMIDHGQLAREINLYIDQTISDNLYTLWLCNLKLTFKMCTPKNEEIVKKICSLYVRMTLFMNEHFKKKNSNEMEHEINNACFDVLMEYMCLFILHETHDFYLTYESIATNVLTNDILKMKFLTIIKNNFMLHDEGNIERCIYILHVCIGIYKNTIKSEMPILYSYMANFVIVYLIKLMLKYMDKYFSVQKGFEGTPNGECRRSDGNSYERGSNEKVSIGRDSNERVSIGRDSNERGIIEGIFEKGIEPMRKIGTAIGDEQLQGGERAPSNSKEEMNYKFTNYKEKQMKHIYDNIVTYEREENFHKGFEIFQNDMKQMLGVEYLKDYNIGEAFKIFNFFTINEDNYSYINKHSVFTLIAILSIYESNFLNYILISFLVYFKINVPTFASTIFYYAHYIHNKNSMMSIMLFIHVLTENYFFTDLIPSLVNSHFSTCSRGGSGGSGGSSSTSTHIKYILYDKNKSDNLFLCTKDDYTYLIIQLLKLINTILNTSTDIYIEKKNILHLNTVSSNFTATKMYHSANYNLVLKSVLKHEDLPHVCDKALENILTYLLDVKDHDEWQRTNIIVNYMRENIEGMNIALVDMYKKYMSYQEGKVLPP